MRKVFIENSMKRDVTAWSQGVFPAF